MYEIRLQPARQAAGIPDHGQAAHVLRHPRTDVNKNKLQRVHKRALPLCVWAAHSRPELNAAAKFGAAAQVQRPDLLPKVSR
jgi:hypothetical protein